MTREESKRNHKRDEFAKYAMLGMLVFGGTNERDPEYIGKKSYAIADGMLRWSR